MKVPEGENAVPPTVLLVHGRGFKPASGDLLELGTAAMAAGIARDCPDALQAFLGCDKRIGYYGDLSNDLLARGGAHYDGSLDLSDRKRALQELRALTRRKHFGVRRYDRLPGKSALPEFAADIGAPLLGAMGLGSLLVGRVAADLQEYWNEAGNYTARVRERVRSAIMHALDGGGRLLLVSHGTGCIVSYDVLWQLSHDEEYAPRYGRWKIDQWLTLGAPLGDSMVRRRLLGARERGRARYPTNVLVWQNVSAEDDFMCHDNTIRNDFKSMLKLRLISAIHDYHIHNLAVRYGRSDPHSSIGYLIHPRVSKIVVDWLRAADGAAGA